MTARLTDLFVPATAHAWRDAGFAVARDTVVIGEVAVRLTGAAGGPMAWSLIGLDDAETADVPAVDGIPTRPAPRDDAETPRMSRVAHPNGVTRIDHVVVNTPDLERTCAAIEVATGAGLRRIREAGAIRQGFHRVGDVIVEVVTHPDVAPGPAMLWGLALVADDLDALVAAAAAGSVGTPRDAVQRGRRIVSFTRDAQLGVPVAVMTPHVAG